MEQLMPMVDCPGSFTKEFTNSDELFDFIRAKFSVSSSFTSFLLGSNPMSHVGGFIRLTFFEQLLSYLEKCRLIYWLFLLIYLLDGELSSTKYCSGKECVDFRIQPVNIEYFCWGEHVFLFHSSQYPVRWCFKLNIPEGRSSSFVNSSDRSKSHHTRVNVSQKPTQHMLLECPRENVALADNLITRQYRATSVNLGWAHLDTKHN